MHHFKVSPERIKELRKPLFIRMIILFFILLSFFVVPDILSGATIEFNANLLLILGLLLAISTYSLYAGLKKQKALLTSYTLTVAEDSITREMLNTPTISLSKNNVREIIENSNGTFTIIGESKLNAIGIPAQIESRDQLLVLLNEIKPLKVLTSPSWIEKLHWPLAMAGVGLMFITYYVNNKFISTLSGIGFIVMMVYCFIVIQKSKNIDNRIKRTSYLILLPMLSVIYAVIVKWMGE